MRCQVNSVLAILEAHAIFWKSTELNELITPHSFAKFELLHLDHEQDVVITCDMYMWVRAIATQPALN